MAAFKQAKGELKQRLASLNDTLNRRMHAATHLDYEDWLKSHQPFHWLAEFYQIIKGNGGFDVIIGNPPYVVYTKKNNESGKAIADIYKLSGYKTLNCNNLYAFVIERSINILSAHKRFGMIVPLSFGAAKNMSSLRSLFSEECCYVSSYEIRPSKLFDGAKGAEQRLNIFISHYTDTPSIKTTNVLRWNADQRNLLFKCIHYEDSFINERIWRISSKIEASIYRKYITNKPLLYEISNDIKHRIHYRSAGLRYWIIFVRNGFNTESASNKNKGFDSATKADYYMSALNSNLYWWYYSLNYDMFNQTDANILDFQLSYNEKIEINIFAKILEEDLDKNKTLLVTNKKDGDTNVSYAYNKRLSKSIIDKIDKALAEHYGFTEEELDFIINYDIKYRIGDELNE